MIKITKFEYIQREMEEETEKNSKLQFYWPLKFVTKL